MTLTRLFEKWYLRRIRRSGRRFFLTSNTPVTTASHGSMWADDMVRYQDKGTLSCPLQAIGVYEGFPNDLFASMVEAKRNIIFAADHAKGHLRPELLRACGLGEE